MNSLKKSFFPYIKNLLFIAIPIILQQLFLNIASLLDTMMVGQLDSFSVSGVYVANQIIFVINLLIFGATEGGSVFFSQFYGINDERSMRKCFIFKLYFSIFASIIAILVVNIFAKGLVNLYISEERASEIAISYLHLLSLSFIPYAITNSIATSLREIHKPNMPMISAMIGTVLNFSINYLLIFGIFSLPKLGAIGAAIGTISERYLEMIILIVYLFIKKFSFSRNLFKHLKIEFSLLKKLFIRSLPLILNEFLYAFGQSVLIFIFSKQNSIATISLPIATTIYNLLFVVCIGLGNSITILLGNTLGQNNEKEARKQALYSLIFSFTVGLILGLILFFISHFIASLYTGLEQEYQEMGELLIKLYAIYITICSQTSSCFYIIRSGGKTLIVALFDSGYTWIIQIPLAFLFLYVTHLSFLAFVALVYGIDILKQTIGYIIIFSGSWLKNLTLKNS